MTAASPRRPRLCMVVHAAYPVGEPRVEREAQAALGAGYEVDVISLREPGEPAVEVAKGATVHRLPVRHRRGMGLVRSMFEYCAFTLLASVAVMRLFRARRLDVVHVHAPPDFLVAAGLLPRLLGAALVLDIHDLSPHMFGARFEDRPGAGLVTGTLTAVQRLSCAPANAVVTVHEPYRAELVAGGVPASKIAVVMNAPDDEVVSGIRRTPRRRESGSTFVIAYHGTINHWYGVDLMIEALAGMSDTAAQASAIVLGAGDALEDVRRRAAALGVDDRVTFSGRYVPLEEALAGVAEADCGVIPNRPSTLNRFALSSKLFEYIALGIPVVVSRLPTLAAHFGEDEVTFFEPGDPGALTDAMRWVAAHPDEAAAKSERATARARSYSWARNRHRYLEAVARARGVPTMASTVDAEADATSR